MRCTLTTLACVTVAMAWGCRTSEPIAQSTSTANLTAQVTALSNEITRINDRLDITEMKWREMSSSMRFTERQTDEMRYMPVVQEELIGVSTNEPRKDLPNTPSQDMPHPAR